MERKNNYTMNERLMTLEEVAVYLRLSVHTIYKMAQQGRIPAYKVGKLWRFKKEEIDKWIQKQQFGTTQR